MLAEWTIFTQVSGVQRCPRSSRQVAADDLRPVHAIVVAGRAARPLQRAHPLRALLLPRKPIAPSGEPGAKFMPLLKSAVRRRERADFADFESAAEGRASDFWTCAAGPPSRAPRTA